MEASAADLFSDPEIEELGFIHQWELSSLDQEFPSQSIWECLEETLSPESYTSSSCLDSPRNPPSVKAPEKFPVTSKSRSCPRTNTSIISFGDPSSPIGLQAHSCNNAEGDQMELMNVTGLKMAKVARSRPISLNQEHVIAERKRREKITEKLIALSAMIPGLKKRDKASILTDAIKYMKQMEEKVKTLEGQATKETVPKHAVAVKKCPLSVAGDENGNSFPSDGTNLPDIEARISEKSALIRIHCQESKGVLTKALTEIENHHLTVINTSALPFSDGFLEITVMAQVEEGFSMTVNELLKKLNSAFREFM